MAKTTSPAFPCSVVMRLCPADPALSMLALELHGFAAKMGPDGRHPYSGMATMLGGRYVATIRGFLPPELLPKTASKRRRGRPKNEAIWVACALHEYMAQDVKEITGGSVKALRTAAARAMHRGGKSDADAEKHIRDGAKHKTAKQALADCSGILTFSGDEDAGGRLAVAIRKDTVFKYVPEKQGVLLRGHAWVCQWGDHEATYRKIDWLIGLSDAPEDIQKNITTCHPELPANRV